MGSAVKGLFWQRDTGEPVKLDLFSITEVLLDIEPEPFAEISSFGYIAAVVIIDALLT